MQAPDHTGRRLESSTVHAITTGRVPSNWMHAGFTVRSRGFSSPLVAHRAMTLQAPRPILQLQLLDAPEGEEVGAHVLALEAAPIVVHVDQLAADMIGAF